MIGLVSMSFWLLRLALRWTRRFSILLVVVAMLALNVATLAFAPLGAAAGALLARAGVTTVVESQAGRLARTERRLATAQADLARAERRIAQQSDELAALRHVRYRGHTRTVREAVADTTGRIARRTATATARNVAAIPAEALPFFGIAVILGATAWELSDACALMQDVHELNVAFDPSLANDPAKHEACGLEVPTAAEVWERIATDPAAALEEQPGDYGPLPEFKEPGGWSGSLSWFSRRISAPNL